MVCISLKRLAAAFITAAAAVIICLISSSAAYQDAEVYDTANALSDEEYTQLLDYAHSAAQETGWNIAVEFDPDGDFYSGSSAFDHCVNKFESRFGSNASGVFFYCADHYVYIATSGEAAFYFSDNEADRVSGLGDDIYKTDRIGSIKLVLDGICNEYHSGRNASGGRSPSFSAGGAAGCGLLGAAVFSVIVICSYKTHSKPQTSNYINSRTVRFPVKCDIFIREYTTRHSTGSSSNGRHSGHHHSGGGHHR